MVETAAVLTPVLILATIFIFILANNWIKRRASSGASREELRQIQATLAQIQENIDDLRGQVADLIIQSHDRE